MKRHIAKVIAVTALLAIGVTVQLVPTASEQQSWMLLAERSSQLPPQFTLLNWNIQKRSDQGPWQQQYQQLLQHYQPDLVTLQEVNVNNASSNPSDKPAVFAPNLKTNNGYAGLLSAANDLPNHHHARLSVPTEPLTATPKPTLYSYYRIDQSQLLLVNIHAINFVTNASYQQQLDDLVKQVAYYDGPVIISGDFNSWSQDRQMLLATAMESLSLTQVSFDNGDDITAFFGNRLDHVFYSRHFTVASAQALGQYDSSDHTPLVVNFQLR